jgi:hypothetical protein
VAPTTFPSLFYTTRREKKQKREGTFKKKNRKLKRERKQKQNLFQSSHSNIIGNASKDKTSEAEQEKSKKECVSV